MQLDLRDLADITTVMGGLVSALLEGQNKTTIAEAVGVSRQQLYRWERGVALPTIEELFRLVALVGEELVITFNADADTERLDDVEETQLAILKVVSELHGDIPAVQRLVERVNRRQKKPEAKEA